MKGWPGVFPCCPEAWKTESFPVPFPDSTWKDPIFPPCRAYRGAHPEEHIRLARLGRIFRTTRKGLSRGSNSLLWPRKWRVPFPLSGNARENGVVVSLAHHNATPAIINRQWKQALPSPPTWATAVPMKSTVITIPSGHSCLTTDSPYASLPMAPI